MVSLIYVMLAYLLGIIWGVFLEFDILKMSPIFLCLIIGTLFLKQEKFWKRLLSLIFLLIIFCIGIQYTHYRSKNFQTKYQEGEWSGTVTILTYPKESKYYFQYRVQNEHHDKFMISFPKTDKTRFTIGNELEVKGEFSLGSVARNEGGFDYRRYLHSNGLYGTVRVNSYEVLAYNTKNPIYLIQNGIHQTLIELLPEDISGVLIGMLMGDTTDITDEVKESFQNSGIIHLLAVSGTHISYFLLFSKFIFDGLVGKKYSSYFHIALILFLMTLSGCSPSAVRASIMVILQIIAEMTANYSNSFHHLFIAALIILVINPLSIFNTGFLLSFARNTTEYCYYPQYYKKKF